MNENQTDITAKPPAVRRELEKLHQTVERMGVTIQQLRDRMQPILKLQDANPDSNANKVEVSLVPLAEEIHQIQLKLHAFDNYMQEIINACEL